MSFFTFYRDEFFLTHLDPLLIQIFYILATPRGIEPLLQE